MKNNTLKIAAISLVVVTLTACGGGSDDSTSPEQPPVAETVGPAEGLFLESTTRRQKINFLIVDGLFYGLAGTATENGGMTSVDGVLLATGKSAKGSFSADNLVYFNLTKGPSVGELTGSYVPEIRFEGNLTVNGIPQALSASAPPIGNYNYKASPQLTDITGTWRMNSTMTLNIDSLGFFTATQGGCSNSGFIAPDVKSGKNIFTYGFEVGRTSSCGSNAGKSIYGRAVTYLLPDGKRQLLFIGGPTQDLSFSVQGLAGVR